MICGEREMKLQLMRERERVEVPVDERILSDESRAVGPDSSALSDI